GLPFARASRFDIRRLQPVRKEACFVQRHSSGERKRRGGAALQDASRGHAGVRIVKAFHAVYLSRVSISSSYFFFVSAPRKPVCTKRTFPHDPPEMSWA